MTENTIDINELRSGFFFVETPEVKIKKPNSAALRKDFARIAEMRRLRFIEGKTIQEIGDIYHLSRERIRQLIGNTGHSLIGDKKRMIVKNIDLADKSVQDICQETGFSERLVRTSRKGDRFYIKDTSSNRSKGARIEEWVSADFRKHGIKNTLMPNSGKYDIETRSGLRVEVKASFSKMRPPSVLKRSPKFSGYYSFKTSVDRHAADFLVLVVAEKHPYKMFIIPYSEIKEGASYIHFTLPMRSDNHFAEYLERYDLLIPS